MHNFILTTDQETANQLKKQGYVICQESQNRWLFFNDINLTFSNIDTSKIKHTNVLFL